MKRNRKWKIPPTILERRTLCFRSYKNHKLKSKTVVSWTSPKKKEGIFCTVYFLKICALSQCIVYWIHFQNIHTFTYKKTLLHTLLLLKFLKSSKAFSVSLRQRRDVFVCYRDPQRFFVLIYGVLSSFRPQNFEFKKVRILCGPGAGYESRWSGTGGQIIQRPFQNIYCKYSNLVGT